MSLVITGQRRNATASTSHLGGRSACTLGYFFRFDGTPAAANVSGGCFVHGRNYYGGPWSLMQTSGNGKCRINFAFPMDGGGRPNTTRDYIPGAVYHLVMTFAQGRQLLYESGIPSPMGTSVGTTYTPNGPLHVGGWDGTPKVGTVFSVQGFALWDSDELTQQQIIDWRDGVKTPADLGASLWWTLNGQPGDTPTIGSAGLLDQFGGLGVSTIDGSGSSVWGTALDWSPSVRATVYVPSSGELIGATFRGRDSGIEAIPTTLNITPSVKVNGVSMGTLREQWVTGYHSSFLMSFPEGVSVSASDVVSVSAPAGWMNTNIGLAEGLADVVIGNYAGRSSRGSDLVRRSLRMGANISPNDTSVMNVAISRNQTKRQDPYFASTRRYDGYPLTIAGPYTVASLLFCPDNAIDPTGYPGPIGPHAIVWDDLDPTQGLDFCFANAGGYVDTDSIMVTTHWSDMDNPGTLVGGKRVGVGRVFDIQPAPGATTAQRLVRTKMFVNNHTPKFENMVVYGPNDFKIVRGTPVVVDRDDPIHPSAEVMERMNRAGSIRWIDSMIEVAGSSYMSEPEHLNHKGDFTWGFGRATFNKRNGIRQFRPYSASNIPYIYSSNSSFGSTYPITLAAPMDASQTTMTVTYSTANPVFAHLRVFLGSETVRVDSVASGTLADGSTVVLNVTRGGDWNLTTPASHAAGSYQCGWRFPLTDPALLSLSPGFICEVVFDAPHELWSGFGLSWSGTYPTFEWEGPMFLNCSQWSALGWVSGPDRMFIGTYQGTVPGVINLKYTYNLDPSVCHSPCVIPKDGSFTPFDAAAHMTGEVSGADFVLDMPQQGTDELFVDIWRQVRDNFPPGRRIYAELSNEVWNFGFAQWRYYTPLTNSVLGLHADPYPSLMLRSKKMWEIGEAVFNEGGRGRGHEIVRFVNVISRPGASLTATLDFCAANSIRVDAVALAPYVDAPEYAGDTETVIRQNRYTHRQCIDLYTHCCLTNASIDTGGFIPSWKDTRARMDAYTAATGYRVKLVSYEGDLGTPIIPSFAGSGSLSTVNGSKAVVGTGSNFLKLFRVGDLISIVDNKTTGARVVYTVETLTDDTHLTLTAPYAGGTDSGRGYRLDVTYVREKSQDMLYDPLWYTAQQDFYAAVQESGFAMFNVYRYAGTQYVGYYWPMYDWFYQKPVRGDGSDGRQDNRLCLAQPGFPNSKSPTTNIYQTNGSVRGGAFKAWNESAGARPVRRSPVPTVGSRRR